MSTLLEAVNIGKRFGGIEALSSISLTIQRGEIYGLIGPNGAGKTTFFNVLTGVYRADSGGFNFNDRVLNISAPHEVAASGIARTFQNIRLFANMSALENVMVGRHVRTRAGIFGAILRDARTRAEERAIHERARTLLEYVGLSGRGDELARSLPYGDQRRLEIARALATDPHLLALDDVPAQGIERAHPLALLAHQPDKIARGGPAAVKNMLACIGAGGAACGDQLFGAAAQHPKRPPDHRIGPVPCRRR